MAQLLVRAKPGTEGPVWVEGWENPSHQALGRNILAAVRFLRQLSGLDLMWSKGAAEDLYTGKPVEINLSDQKGPSGFTVGLVEFSVKENPHARQRTLPAHPWLGIALVRR